MYGSVLHALSVLRDDASSSAQHHFNAASLTLDTLIDNTILMAALAHTTLARFRRLPLPDAFASGIFPKLFGLPAASCEIVSVTEGGDSWVRVYHWRTGSICYKNSSTKEVVFPDGGPHAIFEEFDVDIYEVGDGVTIGPSFKVRLQPILPDIRNTYLTPFQVIIDDSDEFIEMWGSKLSKSRFSTWSNDVDHIIEAAFMNSDCWLVVAFYGAIAFTIVLGTSRAYHSSSALGFVAVLFVLKHIQIRTPN